MTLLLLGKGAVLARWIVPPLTAQMDENRASAGARSARASLLHRWEASSDAVVIKLHA